MNSGGCYCGMCTTDHPFAVGLRALGSARKGDRYWFVGGHIFREEYASGEFFQVSEADVEVWKRVRKGTVSEIQLGASVRGVLPKLCAKRLAPSLCNAFYATPQQLGPQGDECVPARDCKMTTLS